MVYGVEGLYADHNYNDQRKTWERFSEKIVQLSTLYHSPNKS